MLYSDLYLWKQHMGRNQSWRFLLSFSCYWSLVWSLISFILTIVVHHTISSTLLSAASRLTNTTAFLLSLQSFLNKLRCCHKCASLKCSAKHGEACACCSHSRLPCSTRCVLTRSQQDLSLQRGRSSPSVTKGTFLLSALPSA